MIKKTGISILRGQQGVTLTELLVVVAILAILAGLSLGALNFVANRKADEATNQIYAEMQYARVQAIYGNRVYMITFAYPQSNQYQIQYQPASGGAWSLVNSTLSGSSTTSLPSGMTFGSSAGQGINLPGGAIENLTASGITFANNAVTFQPSGSSVAGTAYIVPAQDIGTTMSNRSRAVTMQYPTTGKIKAYRYDGVSWNDF